MNVQWMNKYNNLHMQIITVNNVRGLKHMNLEMYKTCMQINHSKI